MKQVARKDKIMDMKDFDSISAELNSVMDEVAKDKMKAMVDDFYTKDKEKDAEAEQEEKDDEDDE